MKHFSILVIILCLTSCSKVANDLTLTRMDYLGNNLKINGYFYHPHETGYQVFFLYKNGIYFSLGFFPNISTLNQLDNKVRNAETVEGTKELQWFWGVFKVDNNLIAIDRWIPGNNPYQTQLLKGEISTDSIISISGLRGTEYQGQIDAFKFRQLHPKPDSSNNFIQ